ncbi:hypothetical protein [Lentzea sp. NPDC004782]|uniref:hypothetical protein n=1 Tax=Lentzea sp. NPDC004782 TaxID=3154458 RepID=UPI0033AB239B
MDYAVREEIFGPVAALIPFDTEDEVCRAGQRHRLRPRLLPVDQRPEPRPPEPW